MARVYSEEVAGSVYKTKEGNTLSLAFKGEINHLGVTSFIAECNVCSLDEELFPYGSINVTIKNYRNKVAKCGCSKGFDYTPRQRKVQVKRLLKDSGWRFIDFPEGVQGTVKTRVRLYNTVTGGYWNPLLANILKNGVPVARGSKKDMEAFQEWFSEYKDRYPKGTKVVRNLKKGRKSVLLSCPVCNTSKLPVRPDFIVEGRRSCKCGSKHNGHYPLRLQETDTLYLVKLSKESEVFLKVGRTFDTYERFKTIRKTYDLEVLKLVEDTHEKVFDLEKKIHYNLYELGMHYKPEHYFGGAINECFLLESEGSINKHLEE